MSDELVLDSPRDVATMPGFGSESSWKLANRIGQAFAASSLVPASYQDNVANCIVALEMANRMGASPLMVMQNLYIVHGNPGWSSKFLIACFNQSGRYSALRYQFNEKRDTCHAWAIERSTGDRLDGPTVSIAMAKDEGWSTKSGSKWKTMPELMLMYRAAAFMIRTYAPELSMGLQTSDELADTYGDVERLPKKGQTLNLDDLPIRQAADVIDQATGEITPIKKPGKTYAQWVDLVQGAKDADAAAQLLDESGADLPDDQQGELAIVYRTKWAGQ